MIETERLKLISCDENHFQALLKSENELANLLQMSLADEWLGFPDSVTVGFEMLKANPENLHWGMRIFVHKKDNKIVGYGGFKGAANENGMVEIGYAIAPEYQNRGLASEAAKGMIDFGFLHSFVKAIDAHTLAKENASVKVLQKCGMIKIGEKFDTEDGDIWHWRISREGFEDKEKISRN